MNAKTFFDIYLSPFGESPLDRALPLVKSGDTYWPTVTKESGTMLLAIGLQESGFRTRKQDRGPARSFWQFETSGIHRVLQDTATADMAAKLCTTLCHRADISHLYHCIADNDLLAAGFARLLLWNDPAPLPKSHDPDEGWGIYVRMWAPGKPHKERWGDNWQEALDIVAGRA